MPEEPTLKPLRKIGEPPKPTPEDWRLWGESPLEPRIAEIERLIAEPMPQQERIPLELELEKLRPTPIEEPELEPEDQLTIEELVGRIYQGYESITMNFIKEWAAAEPEAFLEDMIRFRGRTPDTELMLELFGATPEDIDTLFAPTPTPEPLKIPEGGYQFTQDVAGVERLFTIDKDYLVKLEDTVIGKYDPERGGIVSWGTQQTVVPVDGIRKLLTITPDNRAYDENNNFLGTYNSVTQEIDKVSTIDKASEVWDALIFGSRQMWELGENFFLSALPNLVFQDTPAYQRAVYGDEFSDRVDAISQSVRDKFRSAYAGNKAEFEEWVEKNPEMKGRIDYQESWAEHPELLKDPFYYAYELANIAPFCAAVVLSSITAGALTGGNPLAMITGGAAVVYPVETQAVMEALLANGADEQQAAKIAGPAGIIIASLESIGRVPLLKAVSPYLNRLFRKEAANELGKLTARELLKRGIKTAVATELSEVITEVLQEAVQNAAVKIVNENQSILEGLDVIAAKTAVATLGLSLFGGGVSMRRVAPSETQGFTDLELQQKGFVKEPKSGNWYAKVKELVADERGALGVPEEKPTSLPVEQVIKYETRIPLDLIRKDERESLDRLSDEIQREGIKEPITIRVREDGSLIVWDGIHRLIVAQELGIKDIPVKYIGEVGKLVEAPLIKVQKPTTEQIWDTMEAEEREAWASQAEIDRETVSKAWADLTKVQQDDLLLAREEVAPPIEEQPIPQGVAEAIPITRDIGALELVRPARKVFQKMGLREVYKGIQKAEVESAEELKGTMEYIKDARNLVEDKKRIPKVMEALEDPSKFNELTFGEKRAYAKLKDFWDSWADVLGLTEEQRQKNYVTHIFEEDITADLKAEKQLDMNIASVLDETAPSKIFNPFLQERLGAEVGLITDPFLAAEAYARKQIKIFYYQPLLEKISYLANDPKTPPIAARYLNDYTRRMTGEPSNLDKAMDNTIKDFAEKIRTLPGGEALYPYLTRGNPSGVAAYNFTSALYVLWLGFKPTSAIRNLSQHTLIIGDVGPVHFAEGVALRFTKEGRDAVNNHSLVWRSRKAAFVPGIDDSFAAQWSDSFRETALWMFRKADEQNVKDAFLAGYAEAKAMLPNADPQVWYDRGDEVAADTQYLYTKMNSPAWSQNSMGRTLSVLTTWAENWTELMGKWITRTPSQVYLEHEARTGEKVSRANWATTYQAIGLYMLLIGLGYLIKDETRLKAWEYTGVTSIRYLADVISGDFPGLQIPGAIANIVAGFLTDDERRLKQGWNEAKGSITPGIIRQLDNWASGERDWATLFFYLEGLDWKIKKLKDDWKGDVKEYQDITSPKERTEYRETHPKIEAKLFITGQFTTLSSEEARQEVLRLIEEHDLDPSLIKGYDKVFPLDTSEELDEFTERIGNLEKLEVGVEAEYFKTSNFATEVNRLVDTVGRTKIEKDGNPFAVEYLQSKDQWEAYYALEEDGRTLFRQQFPDVEASLYLFGKVQSFKNPKSAEIMLGLMDKYDIPPEGVPAFIKDPAKYDALFTREFKITQQWFDLNTEYDNMSNPESASYVESEELRKAKREELRENNPDWVADMRRLEAIQHDASDVVVESWAERGKVIDKFEAGSSEAMVWLVDNPEVHQWALDQKLLTDDGKEWNVPSLRITAKWRVQDNEYDALPVEDDARANYLATNEEYRMDRRRREAYNGGFSEVENFVNYHELPVKGYRQEQFLLDNPSFAKEMRRIKGIDLPDPAKIPSPKYDDIYESRKADFDKLFGLADEIENVELREEIRNSMLYTNGKPNDLFRDSKRLEAYKLFIPEKHIEAYVKMSVEPDRGFRDERYLKDNPDFYKDVWLDIMKNDRVDFSKVPHEEYDNIYDRYRKLFDEWDAYKDPDSPLFIQDTDKRAEARDKLTLLNPDFAEAMIRRTGYKVLIGQEEHVDNYVTYYQLLTVGKPKDVDVWYEDDWFLMENPEFRKAVSRALGWEIKDFSKVPPRDVFRLYQIYCRLDKGKIRENYRAQHPELDEWMVLTGKISKTVEEQEALAELSKAERIALELWEAEQARGEEREAGRRTIEELLAEIERKLRGLTK